MKSFALCLGLLLAATGQAAEIRIGAKVFTEQAILSELTAQYLRPHGYQARIVGNLGSTIAWNGMKSGQLDLTWEYTGTSLVAYNKVTERLDKEAAYERVKALDAKSGAIWLTPTRFNNTYALALPEQVAKEHPDIHSISDLAAALQQPGEGSRLLALDIEFANRSDGLAGLVKEYDLRFSRDEVRQMDPGLVYTALRNGQVFVGLVYTTDGRLDSFGLRLLEDDKGYFPDYTAAPVVNADYLQAHPDLRELLKPLAERLDDATMRRLNARVDVQRESPAAVAADFLREQKLIEGER
ncbi:glycine betaine ABC transporter substrate-binding protein [Phytopseudomonas dryadis]|uniref:Glycine/betaine ABC transporter substrate-binding protein n=1 Tax=Phytopseudomonas dryadis TaxID=2487520 RepID=A0A4Q9QUE5_9GAMM|nr:MULTISPECIES: glycine betaine ABC transporter substrate-binding protein [Pseudomonas]TBU85216.1 glycine/betaine ABC transporter substrate-binding protein [Pseudomonas dryadis]TBV04059.1 glycine/betaine ABC transporter substrate-binding protein [Pseudomonas dryadis]TBV17049.1 glycine/betaine ABC transporter substrate-binding protein [Pseudomonas sp. FRB 230]